MTHLRIHLKTISVNLGPGVWKLLAFLSVAAVAELQNSDVTSYFVSAQDTIWHVLKNEKFKSAFIKL